MAQRSLLLNAYRTYVRVNFAWMKFFIKTVMKTLLLAFLAIKITPKEVHTFRGLSNWVSIVISRDQTLRELSVNMISCFTI